MVKVPDPDLEIKGGGGRSSRHLDKGGGGEPSLQKMFSKCVLFECAGAVKFFLSLFFFLFFHFSFVDFFNRLVALFLQNFKL